MQGSAGQLRFAGEVVGDHRSLRALDPEESHPKEAWTGGNLQGSTYLVTYTRLTI